MKQKTNNAHKRRYTYSNKQPKKWYDDLFDKNTRQFLIVYIVGAHLNESAVIQLQTEL